MASTRSSAGKLKSGFADFYQIRLTTSLKRTVRISLQSTYSKIEIYPYSVGHLHNAFRPFINILFLPQTL